MDFLAVPSLIEESLPVDNGVNFGKRKRAKLEFTVLDPDLKARTEIYIKKCKEGTIQPDLADFDKNVYILEHRNSTKFDTF